MGYPVWKHNSPRGESTKETKWTKIVEIVAILSLVAVFSINAVTTRLDGNLTGVIVGAIVYVATKTYYKEKLKQSG